MVLDFILMMDSQRKRWTNVRWNLSLCRALYELESKLLKGGYIGDYMGDTMGGSKGILGV